MEHIQQLLHLQWRVLVWHTYREANSVADFLASFAYSLPIGVHIVDHPPVGCTQLLWQDYARTVFARRIGS